MCVGGGFRSGGPVRGGGGGGGGGLGCEPRIEVIMKMQKVGAARGVRGVG